MMAMELALFDLDNTLLAGDSDHAWAEFLIDEGLLDGAEFRAKNDAFYEQYKAGTLDIQDYLRFALSTIAGRPLAQLREWHAQFMKKKIVPMVHAQSWPLLKQHEQATRMIVTATNAFVTAPIAQYLGVEHLIACEAEVRGGVYTGEPIGIPSFREGKVTRIEQWLAERGKSWASFSRTTFYSDSQNDLPLLEKVTHPVAVDPDPILRAHAEKRGWPIVSLRDAA